MCLWKDRYDVISKMIATYYVNLQFDIMQTLHAKVMHDAPSMRLEYTWCNFHPHTNTHEN